MATSLQQTVSQNLECPVCLSFFKNPKILNCSHTFCEGCLKALLGSHPDKGNVSCPTCRKETPVPCGDVDRLQTNITVRSLVEDLETQSHVCSNCDPGDKKTAVVFCNECGDYLCDSCRIVHSKWAKFSGHSIIAISDVSSEKIPQRRWSKCGKHLTEEEERFCLDCSKYVCLKCVLLEHANKAHKVMEASTYETEQKNNVDELVSKADAKICDIDKHVTLVVDQRTKMKTLEKHLIDEIDEALDQTVKKLKERNKILKNQVRHHIKEIENALRDTEKRGHGQIVQVNKLCGLVKDGLQFPLEKEALTSHRAMYQQLESLLSQIKLDDELLSKTAEKGKQLGFRSQELDGLKLGQLRQKESKWILQAEEQLPTNSMNCMAVSPNNKMAVGCYTGGIFAYSAEGMLHETVLKTVRIRALDFMPDGRYIIRDNDNRLCLYTELCDKLDVAFETLNHAKGGLGGLTVDKDGIILTSYDKCKTIHVLKAEGGKAIREIPSKGFTPMQISAMKSRQAVVVANGSNGIRVIDRVSGATVHCTVTKDVVFCCPTVCKDDSVIIACVKHDQGLMSIDQYTKELKHIKNILTDFKIAKPSRRWYYLQQFKTGELAFCTPDKLYIFRETWE